MLLEYPVTGTATGVVILLTVGAASAAGAVLPPIAGAGSIVGTFGLLNILMTTRTMTKMTTATPMEITIGVV